jgi:hypothetical protein
MVRLAACQRVTRAQTFTGPDSFAHFTLFGYVTAGRDTGNLAFETAAAAEHAGFLALAIEAATGRPATIEVTDLSGGAMAPVLEAVAARLVDIDGVTLRSDPERTAGRGYYSEFCLKGYAAHDGGTLEVADGGLVTWTQQLVASRKERMMISGIGLDRLATAAGRGG